MSRGLALTFILQLCAFLHWGLGQTVPLEAERFFDDIETSVKLIANSGLADYNKRQELWNTCNSDTRCSVYACKPLRLSAANSECLAGAGGGVCGENMACKNATLATRSYIRLPTKAVESKVTCDTLWMAICAQKDLDRQALESVYSKDRGPFNRIAWSMFGASNGVFRIYPRLVVVLLDMGGSMANSLSVSQGNRVKVFAAAQSIAQDFLDTLTDGDVVSVYSFDSSGATIIHEKTHIVKFAAHPKTQAGNQFQTVCTVL